MSRLRSRLAKALAAIAVNIVLCGGFEGMSHLVLGPPMAPMLVASRWDGTPPFREEDGAVQAAFQEPFATTRFPRVPTLPRVLVFGESSMLDPRIDLQYRIDSQLTGALERAGLQAEVINLGCPGLDSNDIRTIIDRAVEYAPTVAVIYMGHNDVGNVAMERTVVYQGSYATARVVAAAHGLWSYTLLTRLLQPLQRQGPRPPGAPAGRAISDSERLVLHERFASNLAWSVHRLRSVGTRVVLSTVVSDLAAADIAMPTDDRCAGVDLRAVVGAGRRGDLATLQPIVASHPRCGAALYALGEAEWRAYGNSPQVVTALVRARDEDGVPLRADTGILEAIRRVAAEEDAVLVDPATDWFRDGLPTGEPLFIDNLHFSVFGLQRLAEDLTPPVADALRAAADG